MTAWNVINIVWGTAGAIWVVSRAGNPASTWGWVAFMIISPPLATLMRLLVVDRRAEPAPPPTDMRGTRLQNCILANCGARLTSHNSVQTLHNADRTFAAIIRDLQRARERIDIEYYIISDDGIGRAIARILMRRARAGVRVRIIYDALGSWRLGGRLLRMMRREGIETAPYGRLRFPYLTPSVHRRNHRKLIVIDGRTAYLGGINIAGRYIDGGKMGFWRDEHIRIEGHAARQAADIFAADWLKATGGKVADGKATDETAASRGADRSAPLPAAPPRPAPHCNLHVQIAWAQKGPTRHTLTSAFIEAIASARRNIRISTPYFLPPQTLLEAIRSAARSGVGVELLVPLRTDIPLIGRAADSYLRQCAEAGVAVYRYRNGFMHSKTIIIDDNIVTVGSANMDYRSLEYNLEAVAFVYDRATAADCISKFYADVGVSDRVTASALASCSRGARLAEAFARLAAPIL